MLMAKNYQNRPMFHKVILKSDPVFLRHGIDFAVDVQFDANLSCSLFYS